MKYASLLLRKFHKINLDRLNRLDGLERLDGLDGLDLEWIRSYAFLLLDRIYRILWILFSPGARRPSAEGRSILTILLILSNVTKTVY